MQQTEHHFQYCYQGTFKDDRLAEEVTGQRKYDHHDAEECNLPQHL